MTSSEEGPKSTEPFDEATYFNVLELEFRDPETLRAAELRIRTEAPELYALIADESARLAPGDPRGHAFYFSEMILLATSELHVEAAAYFNDKIQAA